MTNDYTNPLIHFFHLIPYIVPGDKESRPNLQPSTTLPARLCDEPAPWTALLLSALCWHPLLVGRSGRHGSPGESALGERPTNNAPGAAGRACRAVRKEPGHQPCFSTLSPQSRRGFPGEKRCRRSLPAPWKIS